MGYAPGSADFFGAFADFTLPAPGTYYIFIRAVGWLDPFLESEYVVLGVEIVEP